MNPHQQNDAVQKIAGRIARVERHLKALRTPQLGNSSVDNGAVEFYDGRGQLAAIVGTQFDGATAAVSVSGPIPPQPTAGQLEATIGGVTFTWDGLYALGESVATPSDWLRAEVHIGTSADMDAQDAPTATIETPRGGTVFIPVPTGTTVYARLVVRTLSGKRSAASLTSGPVTVEPIGQGTTIYQGPTEPEDPLIGELWLKTLPADPSQPGVVQQETWRYQGPPDGWVRHVDQSVTAALAELAAQQGALEQQGLDIIAAQQTATNAGTAAASAASAAAAAQGTANAANTLAGQAKTEADRKIVVWRQTTEPTGLGVADTNDLWLHPTTRVLKVWDGDSWEPADDQRIADALTAAQGAATTVATKTTVYAQDTTPTPPPAGNTLGDLWFKTNEGNRQLVWQPTTITRTNLSTNPSFEDQAVGTYTSLTGWTNTSGGTVNTLTRSVATAGAVHGTRVGRVVSSSLGQAATSLIGYQQTYTAAPGDVFRISAGVSVLVASTNHLVELRAEWLTGAGAAISDALLRTGVGTTGAQTLSGTTAAAPGTAAQLRLSIYRRGNGGGTNLTNADLNVDAVLVEKNRHASASTTFIVGSATEPGPPDWLPKPLGASALNVTARELGAITVHTSATPTGMIDGDLWIRPADKRVHVRVAGAWVESKDEAINTAATAAATAQATADAKVRIFVGTSQPTGMVAGDVGDLWIDTTIETRPNGTTGPKNAPYTWDGDSWEPRLLGTGAIQPASLVASTVIATGTISAPLLEAIMVLTNIVIAGDPDGFHARLDDTALGFYRPDVDGDEIPELIGRLGGAGGDFLSLVDDEGRLVASIDQAGKGSFQGLTVSGDLTVKGRTLDAILTDLSGQTPGVFEGFPPGQTGQGGGYGPIQGRVGVAETNGYLVAGREYEVRVRSTAMCSADDSTEARIYVLYTGPSSAGSDTAAAPVTTSTEVDHWLHTFHAQTRWETFEFSTRFQATTTGRHRFLYAIERGALGRTGNASASIFVRSEHKTMLSISDLGPSRTRTGGFTQGGGAFVGAAAPAPPAPTPQNYFTELVPAGWVSYWPDGSRRADNINPNGEVGPVQGWAPGTGGSNKGHWFFTIPNITGTITNMEFFAWATHWYYNSGGRGVFNHSTVGNGGPNYNSIKGNVNIDGIQKPGGTSWRLPGDWFEHFTTHPPGGVKFDGITVGPTANNLLEYGKFEGHTARLRIWYVQ